MEKFAQRKAYYSYRIREWARRMRDKSLLNLSRAVPRELAYWVFIRVYAHATSGKYGNTHPDSIGYGEVARRWHEPNGCKRT